MSDKVEISNDMKLKIAIDALNYYMRYYEDSRNSGLITEKITEALRILNK